jgi:hypothetical protein
MALASALLVLGCRLNRQYPPQPIRLIGVSYSPDLAQQTTTSIAAAAGFITSSGDAEAPPMVLDPLQGRLIAKQLAKQAARRDLARKVNVLEIQPGRTVGDLLRSDPEKRRKVEDWIRQAPEKGMIKSGDNKYSILLTLDLRPLNKILDLPGEPLGAAATAAPTAASGRESRQRAESEALNNAQRRALDYVRGLRLPSNETVGDRMSRDGQLDRAIRGRILSLNPSAATFRDNGTCETAIQLDVADIQRILDEHRKGPRWPRGPRWLGFGSFW